MGKLIRAAAAPSTGELALASILRLPWRDVLRTARAAGRALLTIAGSLAILLAVTLFVSQIDETQRIEGLARQAVQGATSDAERFERIAGLVHGAVQRTAADRTADPRAWILPPAGPLGAVVARYPAAGRLLKPFFEPAYESFLKPGALQAYFHFPDCAGASRLMIRLLDAVGIKASKLSLYDSQGVGRHAVVEARVDGRWGVADANHGYVYRLPDGRLATAGDLARDPGIARAHLGPRDNPVIADFRNTRTMNWEKIPVVMPLAYEGLHRLIGDRVDRFPRPGFVEFPKLLAAWFFTGLGGFLLLPAASLGSRRLLRAGLGERLAAAASLATPKRPQATERS